MAQIDEIKKQRLDKLQKIRELGWNPYASKYDKKQTVIETTKMENKQVKTAGRIISFRTHGNIAFADLRDETGKIQVFFQKKLLGDEAYKHLRLLDIGDYLGVEGEVMKTSAGEISISPKQYTLLTKSMLPLPDQWYGLKDVETRYRKRYLDLLINPEIKDVFVTRSKVVTLLREYLDTKGFLEVETPVLQPIYGGTSAEPFITHHNALDADLYLRIADELYLKRLVVGGFDKVYEIGKDFRNEGLSRAHNPEFTQLEFYWAYASYDDLMKLTEEMLVHIIKEIEGTTKITYDGQEYNFKTPWKRSSYSDVFKEYLDIDLSVAHNEETLRKIADERKLIKENVVGYAQILDTVYKKHIRPKLKGPVFLIDHPVELIPLAKRKENDPTKSATFQLLVGGLEVIKAYNELNDPIDQQERWLKDMDLAKKGAADTQVLDKDYIEALSYGMPPTAGWGMGIDRFVSILTNQHTIKDVILFPTLRPEHQSEK